MKRTTRTVIPFDLKLAQIAWEGPTDSGKEYQLLDRMSRPVRIICTDRKSDKYPIVGLRKETYGDEEMVCYTKDGKFIAGKPGNSLQDLELWEIKEESQLSNLEQYIRERLTSFSTKDVLSQNEREIVERAAKDIRYLVAHEWPKPESGSATEN